MSHQIAKLLVATAVLAATAGTVRALTARPAPTRIEVSIDARFGSFTPHVIRANRGDTIHVTLRALDSAHGFKVQGTSVDITAMPGMTTEVTFVVDWNGGREWYCTFSCGPQHGTMTGMIVTESRSRD